MSQIFLGTLLFDKYVHHDELSRIFFRFGAFFINCTPKNSNFEENPNFPFKNTYLIARIVRVSMSVDHTILFSYQKKFPIFPTLFGPYNQKKHF